MNAESSDKQKAFESFMRDFELSAPERRTLSICLEILKCPASEYSDVSLLQIQGSASLWLYDYVNREHPELARTAPDTHAESVQEANPSYHDARKVA